MDNVIWKLTILLEIIVLTGIFRNRWYIFLQWFTICVLFSTFETIPLGQIRQYGTPADYYSAYFAFDIINIGLYTLSIIECFGPRIVRFRPIAFSMIVYLLCKSPAYFLLLTHHGKAAKAIFGDLRYPNLACYLLWTALVWNYDGLGVKSRTTEDNAMNTYIEPEDETEETPKPKTAEEDPGAPPPDIP